MTGKGLDVCTCAHTRACIRAHTCTHSHLPGASTWPHAHAHEHTGMHTTHMVPRHGSGGEGGSLWAPLGRRHSAEHRHAVRGEDHACGGLIGAREVVQALAVLVFLGLQHLLILLQAHHQALVGHCLNVVLIHMGGLVQGTLWRHSVGVRGWREPSWIGGALGCFKGADPKSIIERWRQRWKNGNKKTEQKMERWRPQDREAEADRDQERNRDGRRRRGPKIRMDRRSVLTPRIKVLILKASYEDPSSEPTESIYTAGGRGSPPAISASEDRDGTSGANWPVRSGFGDQGRLPAPTMGLP